jgi:hypothetical protein
MPCGQQGQRQIRAPALALWKQRTGRMMGSRALAADAAALGLVDLTGRGQLLPKSSAMVEESSSPGAILGA